MTTLVDQPTAAPTRKMQAVGITSLIAPLVAGFLVTNLPGLSDACGNEVALAVTVVGTGLAQGAATFLAGYYKRNAATDI